MALEPGTRLGVYEIIALLGSGGMGEVWRARDVKLQREVAIKVLPQALRDEPERLARFEREAKTLASLSHPNIAHVHGFDDSTGAPALIMELVEGPTLADRIARGPIPLDEALVLAKQIAEGLEAAHEQGIIHRDLKPANIKVRPDGTVKILDFGLAKALEPVGAMAVGASMSPTITTPAMTQAGIILGTAAYMSPEQARGKLVDRRADIWAFGCVLFEMLTGRTPFDVGDTVSDTIASILKSVPEWSVLPADTPPHVVTLIRRCLQKDPQRRLPHIGLVRVELDENSDVQPMATATAHPVVRQSLTQRAVPIAIASAVASLVTAVAMMWRTAPIPARGVTRFAVVLPEGQQFTATGRRAIAISGDGRRVAYVANRQLFIRDLSSTESRPVRGTNNLGSVFSPAFSPDGQELAFTTDNGRTIRRIAIEGGVPITVAQFDAGVVSLVWDISGIVFAQLSAIGRISPTGGEQDTLVRARAGEVIQSGQLLPGGQAMLLAVLQPAREGRRDMSSAIVIETVASHERRTLREGGTDPIYVRTGHVLYALGGTIYAMPFDKRFTVTGAPVAVIEGVRRGTTSNLAQLAVSDSGSLIYIPGVAGTATDSSALGLIDREGRLVQRLTMPLAQYDGPRVSPDGTRVAVAIDDGSDATVWTYDLSATKAPQRLTFEGKNRYPVWSSDGLRLAFQSDRNGDRGIFWQRADGTGPVERLTTADRAIEHIPTAFGPRGDTLLYVVTTDKTATLWTLSLGDKTTARFDSVESFMSSTAAWSSDGKWIAYSTEDNSASNIGLIVQPFPATGEKHEITRNRGRFPAWSRDGRELFYFVGPNQMEKVDVSGAPFAISPGTPLQAAGPMLLHSTRVRPFDVLPDGKRFIGLVSATETGDPLTPHIEVVVDWQEELKARVATK